MHSTQMTVARSASLTLAVLALSMASAFAAPSFTDKPDADFSGRVFSQGALPGAEAAVSGRGFTPGQKVTLFRAGEALNNGEAVTVDEKGGFQTKVAIPADAVPGLHPVVASASNPSAAAVFDLKVVAQVPQSGAEQFTVVSEKLVQGLYQAAYSAKNDTLFVTAAVGRPPVKQSQLLKLDAKTLKTVTSVDMAKVPNRDDGHTYAVYGVDVDDKNGNVWVTNTRQGTVSVHKQSDLKLVKRFADGAAYHARDVAVFEAGNKAYVSTPGKNTVVVFDTKKLAHLKDIAIDSDEDRSFSTMSLALDEQGGKLYTISGSTREVAVIDTKTDRVESVLRVPGIKSGSGIAVDPKGKRLYVVVQGSDNLVIVDLASGKPMHTVAIGAGALNVAFEPKTGLAYVVSRGAGTVTAVDADGKIVANLAGGTFPNHVAVDGKGAAYAINKSKGADDPEGDRISRIVKK